MPLNDLLDVYGQDILNGVSEDSWRAVSGEDGNIYGIPYKYPYAQEVQGFMVCRWDLMQEAGIEAIPTTIDEFYDCLVKLKGNTAQKSSHNIARYDIIKKWINK